MRAMMTPFWRMVLCALLVAQGTACAVKEEVRVWTPQPRLGWHDISTQSIQPANNGYRILLSQPTQGLFPAAMGVTRIGVIQTDDGAKGTSKRLFQDPRNECLRWNSAFDDQMAISEVFPIAHRDLGGAKAQPEHVIAALHALHAGIGLVYAVNELSETETEMFGALYDVPSGQPIASIHSRAKSIEVPEDKDEPANLWEVDSRALVREAFEAHVYACLRELIAADRPAIVESPTGWEPAGPTMQVVWPPSHVRRP